MEAHLLAVGVGGILVGWYLNREGLKEPVWVQRAREPARPIVVLGCGSCADFDLCSIEPGACFEGHRQAERSR